MQATDVPAAADCPKRMSGRFKPTWTDWLPLLLALTPNFAGQSDFEYSHHLGTIIISGYTGPSNATVVVEACTDLANPLWSPVGTNALTDGSSNFADPAWMTDSRRVYRLRSP